ncbi:MAG: MFS transporter [Verrucomicrobiota bacterium]
MYPRSVKLGAFVLEGLNALALTFYFFYFYFYTKEKFGFTDLHNLLLAAFGGFIYMVAAIYGGRYGQRKGYFAALKVGYVLMPVSLFAGSTLPGLPAQLTVMGVCTFGMCFTWPNLEAIVSEHESPARLQRMIGIYNLVWAGCMAVAYFSGGAMVERFGFQSIFLVPGGITVCQLLLTVWLERKSHAAAQAQEIIQPVTATGEPALNPRPIARVKAFLKMAWLANPFAYVAVNALLPVIPGVANKLNLGTKLAGFVCSIWFFARVAAFVVLWLWPGWHYRFGWLAVSYAAMVVSFAAILLAPVLWVLIAAQIVFGCAIGLIYYSSLYYSMDVGTETKGEHGGIHEAAIGGGNCAGPLLGAMGLWLFPASLHSGTWVVTALLACGFGGLVWLGRRK